MAALSSHLRDLIVSKSGGLGALLELPESLKVRYKEQADRCPLRFLYDALNVTTQCESGYRASVNPRLHIEFALMKLCFLMTQPADQTSPAVPSAAVPSAASPAPSVVPAPSSVSAAPAAPSAPVVTPVPDASASSSSPSAPVEEQQSRERRTRASRASLSMKSIMDGPQQDESPAPAKEAPAPSDEYIKEKWPELAGLYKDKPRLASMLTTTGLLINGNDDSKMVVFKVVNQAQKDWVEAKLLHELEGSFRKIVGSMKVYLRVDVAPDDSSQKPLAYMPGDQAKELMAENEQVKNLVKALELDIK